MAAQSRCPNPDCRGTQFERVAPEIAGTDRLYLFIQCAACGTVVGTVDEEHRLAVSYMLKQLDKFIRPGAR